MKIPEIIPSEMKTKSRLTRRESKRTTFKLSKKALGDLDWMGETYKVSIKEVFDAICANDNIVDVVVDFIKERDEKNPKQQIRKTFVISNKSLSFLNRKSNEEKITRDSLVEYLILYNKLVFEKILKDEKKNEEKALELISEFRSAAEKVQKQLAVLLSEDNPIISRFDMISIIVENLHDEVESKISKGTPVDPD